jgi:hypothetical protein
MTGRRAQAPALEPLEARALLVGFYDGPSPIPVQFNLSGTVVGTAVVRPAAVARAETIAIATSGRIAPLGPTKITGSLRIGGGVARGSLVLDSRLSTLPLEIAGAAPVTSAPLAATLPFRFHGRGAVPGTLFSSQQELGSGTISLRLAAGSRRVALVLVLQPSSNGPAEEQL